MHKYKLYNRPVVFIHGNSDGALANGSEEWNQGWSASIEYFLQNGYKSAELYAITYGDRNMNNSMQRFSLAEKIIIYSLRVETNKFWPSHISQEYFLRIKLNIMKLPNIRYYNRQSIATLG